MTMDRFRSVQKLDNPCRPVAESGPKHISGIMSQVLAQRYSNGFADCVAQDGKRFELMSLGKPVSPGSSVAGNGRLPQINLRLEANSLLPTITS
jgi:hypothetical protein